MEKVWAELKALREDFNREMAELRGELITKMDALGARWGIKSERAFRNGIKGILESRFNVKVIKWIVNDETGLVFGEPTTVDVGVVIRNGEHIMVEIKAHVSKSDVATLLRKAELYKKKEGVKPKLVMISPFVDERAYAFAIKKGISIYSSVYEEEVKELQ